MAGKAPECLNVETCMFSSCPSGTRLIGRPGCRKPRRRPAHVAMCHACMYHERQNCRLLFVPRCRLVSCRCGILGSPLGVPPCLHCLLPKAPSTQAPSTQAPPTRVAHLVVPTQISSCMQVRGTSPRQSQSRLPIHNVTNQIITLDTRRPFMCGHTPPPPFLWKLRTS